MAASSKPPAKRGNPNWQPGVSGNPNGRPLGRKNHITQLKQELEIAVRDHLKPGAITEILDTMVALARQGDVKAAKLILDKVLSNAGEGGDEQSQGGTFVFQVKNLTLKHDVEPEVPAIEAEFEVLPSVPPSNSTQEQ